jgi:peptidylprolyl isomerase
MRLRSILAVLAGLTLALALVACGDEGEGGSSEDASGAGPASDAEGPELGEHWHVAYAFQVCAEVLPPAADRGADVKGIHTHEDGLIHIHPFLAAAAGSDATLEVFLDQIGARLDTDGLELADGDPAGDCADDAVVRVAQWDSAIDAAEGADPDRIITEDLDQIVLAPDLGALTVAVGPADEEIQAPPAVEDICERAAADGAIDHADCSGGSSDPAAGLTEPVVESAAGKPCAGETVDPGAGAPAVAVPAEPPAELVIEDQVTGDGDVAGVGDAVTVDYVGVACSTGEVFDSSYEAGQPATFDLMPGSLIEGFATGVEGMAVGGRRQVTIPSELAYGSAGQGPIAPDEALIFVIELRSVG